MGLLQGFCIGVLEVVELKRRILLGWLRINGIVLICAFTVASIGFDVSRHTGLHGGLKGLQIFLFSSDPSPCCSHHLPEQCISGGFAKGEDQRDGYGDDKREEEKVRYSQFPGADKGFRLVVAQ